MAKIRQVEFAEVCGLTRNAMSVYVQRGKVIVEGGLVDEDHPVNKEFKIRWQDKNGMVGISAPATKPSDRQAEKIVEKQTKREDPDITDEPRGGGSLRDLELQQKKLDVFKRAEEIKNLKVRNEKLNGLVIPTELVKVLFAQHSKSITTSFVQSCENLIMVLQQKKGFTLVEVAELRRSLKAIVNEAVTKSVESSKKQIVNIVAEYSERRGQGEKR